jgi:hypothetical protein
VSYAQLSGNPFCLSYRQVSTAAPQSGAGGICFVIKPQGDADYVMALLLEQRGSHRGINTA